MSRRRRRLAPLLTILVSTIAAGTGISPHAEGPTVTSPRLVRRVEAKFPGQAKKAGIQKAEVHVQFKIDRDGSTLNVEAIDCSNKDAGFEAAAIRAVKKWRYEPALEDGKPVEVYQAVTVRFSLEQAG